MQERGHLAAGDDTAGTVHIVDRRVAAFGDACGADRQRCPLLPDDGGVLVLVVEDAGEGTLVSADGTEMLNGPASRPATGTDSLPVTRM